jgi:hypothetical protein
MQKIIDAERSDLFDVLAHKVGKSTDFNDSSLGPAAARYSEARL